MTRAWPLRRLGDVARITHGYAFSGMTADEPTPLPVVVGIGNLDYSGGFRFDSTTVKRYSGSFPDEFRLHAGDVLLAMTCQTADGAILGIPGRVPNDGTTYLHNQRLGKVEIRNQDDLDLGFVFQLARWSSFNRHLFATASGSKILHTSPGRIEDFKLKLPPIEEQRGIAATLGALDEKIESNSRIRAIAWDLARMHWRTAATRESCKASAVLNPVLGGTPRRDVPEYWCGNVPWASAKDIAASKSGFVLQTAESITDAGVANSAARVLPSGTIVMTARGTVGELARLSRPAAFNQSCYGLVARDGVHEEILYLALVDAVQRVRDAGHGTVFNTVNMATFDQIELDMPVFNERLAETLTSLGQRVLAAEQESVKLRVLRDTLVPELLTGRLRVSAVTEAVEEAGG